MIHYSKKYSINDGQGFIVFEEKIQGTIIGTYEISNQPIPGLVNGTMEDGVLKGTYHNKSNNSVGLIEFSFSANSFSAKWKQGIDPGPMRGKWTGSLKNNSNTDKIVIAKHLEKDDLTYFGAEIAVQKLTKIEVGELIDLIEKNKLTTGENRFLSNYYDNPDYFKVGILLNDEMEYISNLVDNDGLSNPKDIDFFQFESENCSEQPIYQKDDISKLIFEDGFKLITVRFEDVYLKGSGSKNIPIYPGIQAIRIIGSIIFEESNYNFLDGFYQSPNTRHSFNEEEYELETIWGDMNEMSMDNEEGNGNIYPIYQILMYTKDLNIDFEDIYDPEDIKNEIGDLNTIVYSNREFDKISFIEIEEDLSPFKIDDDSIDVDLISEKISKLRSYLN